jgi:hypothetical protein
MVAKTWTIEFYEEDGQSPVERWLDDLDEIARAAALTALGVVLAERGLGVCATEWGKQLGEALFEFRIRHTAEEITSMFGPTDVAGPKVKVLLRIFCHAYGDKVVLLLAGYDKADNPNEKAQAATIKLARKRLVAFKAAGAAAKKLTKKRPKR